MENSGGEEPERRFGGRGGVGGVGGGGKMHTNGTQVLGHLPGHVRAWQKTSQRGH